MMPTGFYRAADYAVALLFSRLTRSRSLPRRARIVIGAAGVADAGAAWLGAGAAGPGSRGGVRQRLSWGGVALVGAGLLLRRESFGVRAALVGVGASRLALVAAGDRAARAWAGGEGADGVGYPPLDVPKQVVNDIYVVDSLLPGLVGRLAGARMTIIRLEDGGLLLHSPVRFSTGLLRAVQRLGPVRHLVAPSFAHWMFVQDWQRACPAAAAWAAPGLRERLQVRMSGVRFDHDLPDHAPEAWGEGIEVVMVRGGLGFHEAALFHQPSRTLVLTDLVLNLEAGKAPALMRPVARLLGVVAPGGMPPIYLRALIKLRLRSAAEGARRLLALRPERVIFAHGRWFERDGTAALRHSLRWLIR